MWFDGALVLPGSLSQFVHESSQAQIHHQPD